MDRLDIQTSPVIKVVLEDTNLHGDRDSHLHGPNDVIGDDVINKVYHNNVESDVLGPGVKINRPTCPLVQDGPTPCVNLGKRSRNDVSPLSIGSTQGPAQRLFYLSQEHYNEPLDLNTPVNDKSDEDEEDPDSPVLHRASQVNGFQRGIPVDGAPNSVGDDVQATIEVGSFVGVDLKGFVSPAESLVVEEGANNSVQ
ncbi:hypothetical protein Hanom_Chr07g00591901 [Helianthus anomalus]